MRIAVADPSDRPTTQQCYEVVQAAAETDDPLGPPWSLTRLRGWMEAPFFPAESWLGRDEPSGDLLGWYYLMLPQPENLDRAYLHVTVHPARRRRGVGTALVRHAARRAAAHDRSILASEAFQGAPGAAFAAAVGASAGLVEARRVQPLGQIPDGRVAELRARAAAKATGYSVVSWFGRTPDEFLAKYAEVENAMGDAPHDEGEEPMVWDAARVRTELDDRRERTGAKVYTVAALHDASGEMAAVTAVEADPDNPAWAHQLLTAVVRKHRGHRLGMLVKSAMLEWLAATEPQLENIVTGNAAVNQPMIAINSDLGYQLLEPAVQSFEMPVADALALGQETGAEET